MEEKYSCQEWKKSVDLFECLLKMDRKAVGLKLLKTKEEYEKADAISLKAAINYCHMVAAATHGNRVKAKSEDFKCRSGARVLGIDKSDPKNAHGENWARLGMYKDAELSATVRNELVYSQEDQYGLLLAPIDQFDDFPDVVIIAAKPYNCMRVIQGYAYHYGMPKNVNMLGNQAVCLECSARPYVIKDMNVSVLCIGTRHRAGWKDDEMAIGIPKEQFANIADGLLQTMNLMENNHNKKIIEDNLKAKGIEFSIRYDYNYYTEC